MLAKNKIKYICVNGQLEEKCRELVSDNIELQNNVDTTEDEITDILKKYKALVQQVTASFNLFELNSLRGALVLLDKFTENIWTYCIRIASLL